MRHTHLKRLGTMLAILAMVAMFTAITSPSANAKGGDPYAHSIVLDLGAITPATVSAAVPLLFTDLRQHGAGKRTKQVKQKPIRLSAPGLDLTIGGPAPADLAAVLRMFPEDASSAEQPKLKRNKRRTTNRINLRTKVYRIDTADGGTGFDHGL